MSNVKNINVSIDAKLWERYVKSIKVSNDTTVDEHFKSWVCSGIGYAIYDAEFPLADCEIDNSLVEVCS